MWKHRNCTVTPTGFTIAHTVERQHRCPHCADDGSVVLDEPGNVSLPCPHCTYGKRRAGRWLIRHDVIVEIGASHYRGVSWENGVTLEHTQACDAPSDSERFPDGYRCRRPARPSVSGIRPLCDVHAAGTVAAPTGAASSYVAEARANHEAWETRRVARRDLADGGVAS